MKVTELYCLIENLRYILLSEHMYFPAISPFLSDWVTNSNETREVPYTYRYTSGHLIPNSVLVIN